MNEPRISPSRAERRKQRQRNARINVILLTFALLCFGSLGWWGASYFIDDRSVATNNQTAVQELTQAWEAEMNLPANDEAKSTKIAENNEVAVEKAKAIEDRVPGQAFATITIPKLFTEEQAIAEGYGDATLADWEANNRILDELRFAHYATTAGPGEAGSFSISGHRNGPGAVLGELDTLRVGDTATVRTANGDYTYKVVQEAVEFGPDYTGFTDNYPLLDEGSMNRSDSAADPSKTPRKFLTVTSCGFWDPSVRIAVVFELVD